jgi:hypothetical protein
VRDLPLHALAQHDEAEPWTLESAQH